MRRRSCLTVLAVAALLQLFALTDARRALGAPESGPPATAAPTATPLPSAGPNTPLRLDDFRTFTGIAAVVAAPRGNDVALITRLPDFDRNRFVGTLRLINLTSGDTTVVTRPLDSPSSPHWSPDGKAIAFLATPGTAGAKAGASPDPALTQPQIAIIDEHSVAPVFVTHEARGINAFGWSRDGKTFAFLTDDEAPNKKAIDAHDDAFEVHDAPWTLNEAPQPSHLWTVAVSGGTPHRRTSGTFSLDGDPVFAPDNRSVLLARYPSAFTNHYYDEQLVRVDLATGNITNIASGPASDPVFSPDGTRLAYRAQNPASFSFDDALLANVDGSHASDVTKALDRVALEFHFTTRNALIVRANDGLRTALYRQTAGGFKPLDLGSLTAGGSFDVTSSGRVVVAASSATTPVELYALEAGGPPKQLTHFNDALLHRPIAPTLAVNWKGAAGFAGDGALTLPLGVPRGRKAPLVLVIHGGPTASSTTAFSELPQLLAARGFYVFQPNYRGSNNLGAAYAQATVPHITSAPGQDVEDGLAAVLAKYPIDTARIGVSGWSEGGLLTSWLITHDTRWKAAMTGAGVHDWLMYHDLTDAQDFTPYFIGKTSPWVDPKMRELFRQESPLTFASAVKTPTLIMTDAGDQRVPEPISYAFYHAIRATGTPVKLVVIPVDGHFPSDPIHNEDVLRRWVDWFATALK